MAKKKALPLKPEGTGPVEKKRSRLIWMAIIAGTFAAMALLSIFTQGPDGTWPDPKLVITRIVFLSVTTAVYFILLFRSRLNGKGDSERKPEKK